MFKFLRNLLRLLLKPKRPKRRSRRGFVRPNPTSLESFGYQPPAVIENSLRSLLADLLEHLSPQQRERIIDATIAAWHQNPDANVALEEGIHGDSGQERGQWVMLEVDHSATDEVEWQAQELAATHGITDQYIWSWEDHADADVCDALSAFEDWLQPRGLTFLHFDCSSDSFAGFVVRISKQSQVLQLAHEAGVSLRE